MWPINRFFCCFLRCKLPNRLCCDDTIIEVLAFLTRRELAKIEGVCRAFHQIVDICFRETPLLFCDRLELDNEFDLDTFLCATAYALKCYPNFQIYIRTKFKVFNEHGKRLKIRTEAAAENFEKKLENCEGFRYCLDRPKKTEENFGRYFLPSNSEAIVSIPQFLRFHSLSILLHDIKPEITDFPSLNFNLLHKFRPSIADAKLKLFLRIDYDKDDDEFRLLPPQKYLLNVLEALQSKIGEFFKGTVKRINILILYRWKEINEVKKCVAFMEKFPFLNDCPKVKYNLWNWSVSLYSSPSIIQFIHFLAQKFQLIELKTASSSSSRRQQKSVRKRYFRMQNNCCEHLRGHGINEMIKKLKEEFVSAITLTDRYFYSIEFWIKANNYNKDIEENIVEESILNSFTNERFSISFTAAEPEDGNHIVHIQRKSLSEDEHIAYEFCFLIKKDRCIDPQFWWCHPTLFYSMHWSVKI